MPMIAEQEANERKKQEAEKNILTDKEKKESIQRVQEHFTQVVNKTITNNVSTPLSQMHNKKRKLHSSQNVKNEENVKGSSTYDIRAQAQVFKNNIVKENLKIHKGETIPEKVNDETNVTIGAEKDLQSFR